jgi:hypothetical protein
MNQISLQEAGRLYGKGGKYYGINGVNFVKSLKNKRFRGQGGYGEAAILLLILFIIFAVVCGPLITIWALNGLFALTIPYTLKTWFCALLLGGVIRGNGFTFKKD